jgi:hypothetical protein
MLGTSAFSARTEFSVTTTGSDQIWSFGRGLAQGADDPAKIWKQLIAQLQPTPVEGATPWVFRGFLNGLHQKNAALAETMLDDAIRDDALTQWHPALETAIGEIIGITQSRLWDRENQDFGNLQATALENFEIRYQNLARTERRSKTLEAFAMFRTYIGLTKHAHMGGSNVVHLRNASHFVATGSTSTT